MMAAIIHQYTWVCAALEDSSSKDSSDAASRQLDSISDKFQPVARSTANLSTLFISLVAWVGVISIILAVIIIVTCRRRRHAAALEPDSSDSISSCSVQLTH